jgi:hypothetical protein
MDRDWDSSNREWRDSWRLIEEDVELPDNDYLSDWEDDLKDAGLDVDSLEKRGEKFARKLAKKKKAALAKKEFNK